MHFCMLKIFCDLMNVKLFCEKSASIGPPKSVSLLKDNLNYDP